MLTAFDARFGVEHGLGVVVVEERAAVLVQVLREVEAVRADDGQVLVVLATRLGRFGELLGSRPQVVPVLWDRDPLLVEQVLPVVQRVGVEVVQHRDHLVAEVHRVLGTLRVLVGDRGPVQLAAGDRSEVLERPVGGQRRQPGHVEGRHVRHLAGADPGGELLVHRVPVECLVVDGDPGELLLEPVEGRLDRRAVAVVVPDLDRHGCRVEAGRRRRGTRDLGPGRRCRTRYGRGRCCCGRSPGAAGAHHECDDGQPDQGP